MNVSRLLRIGVLLLFLGLLVNIPARCLLGRSRIAGQVLNVNCNHFLELLAVLLVLLLFLVVLRVLLTEHFFDRLEFFGAFVAFGRDLQSILFYQNIGFRQSFWGIILRG